MVTWRLFLGEQVSKTSLIVHTTVILSTFHVTQTKKFLHYPSFFIVHAKLLLPLIKSLLLEITSSFNHCCISDI